MNKLIIATALSLSPSVALAVEPPPSMVAGGAPVAEARAPSPAADEGPEVLIGKDSFIRHHGWYVAPSLGATSVDGQSAVMGGLRGAWLVNRTFGLGLALNGFTNDTSEKASTGTIDGGYGGVLLEYRLRPNDVVHAVLDATIGGGGVCIGEGSRDRRGCSDEHAFFMLEPTASVELNVAKHVRIAMGGGYRFASAEAASPLSGGDLGGLVVRSSVIFGEF